jgi:phage tail sheath protein FI
MDLKRILVVAALVAAGVYFWSHRASAPSPISPATEGRAASWDGGNCVRLAESANASLQEASRLLLRLPVDQAAWRDAEGRVQSALQSAESACGGASAEKDRAVEEEVRLALGAMRTLLGELSAGAAGGGGATAIVQRQEEIDRHLDGARSRLRS